MRRNHNAVRASRLGLLFIPAILIVSAVYAGDEDISPSVYQQFDPVTGYMIPVEPPPAGQRNHAPSGETMSDADASITAMPIDNQTGTVTHSQVWIYVFVGMLMVGGFVAWMRNKGKLHTSHFD